MSPYREDPPAPCGECAKRRNRGARWLAFKHASLKAAMWAPAWLAISMVTLAFGFMLRECNAGRMPIQRHEACRAECMSGGRAFEEYLAERCFCDAGNGRVIEVTP